MGSMVVQDLDKRKLVWLASYPKSGNTWMRAFISNYINDLDEPVDINSLHTGHIASARELFDDEVGVEASDLTMEEIDALRPALFVEYACSLETLEYVKVHDAFTYTRSNVALFPAEVTRATFYILRNPLDVAISYADHNRVSIDLTIQFMNDHDHAILENPYRVSNQLRQILMTWSEHVMSWVNTRDMNLHIIKYEDMKLEPSKTFSDILHVTGLEYDEARLEKAIRFSSFESLKKQEQEKGFHEKSPRAEAFFRRGISGGWRDTLTPEQVKSIISVHGEVMCRFGYIDQAGNPV